MNFQEECQPAAKIPTIPLFIPHTQPIAYDKTNYVRRKMLPKLSGSTIDNLSRK
jgi:hypothetical protein